jgi:hypothetical protein
MTTDTGRRATPTEDVVASMLTEPTGRHLLDSGGAYGRNWERNGGMTVEDWRAQPRATLSEWSGITLSLFHYLTERLDYQSDLDEWLGAYGATGDRADEPWLVTAERVAAILATGDPDYASDDRPAGVETFNSYNDEDWLSQVIQWVAVTTDGVELPAIVDSDTGETLAESVEVWPGQYVLLQVHGGCDVRGGYTRARAFMASDYFGYDVADGTLYCTGSAPVDCIGQLATDGSVVTNDREWHAWDCRAGVDVTDRDGSFIRSDDRNPFSLMWDRDAWQDDPDTGERFLPCPECGAPLSADAPYAG